MEAKEILIAARALIENPNDWVRFVLARDRAGDCVLVSDTAACKFCAFGALRRIGAHKSIEAIGYLRAFDLLDRAMGMNIAEFNDTHSHEEVLQAFDKAIQEAA